MHPTRYHIRTLYKFRDAIAEYTSRRHTREDGDDVNKMYGFYDYDDVWDTSAFHRVTRNNEG